MQDPSETMSFSFPPAGTVPLSPIHVYSRANIDEDNPPKGLARRRRDSKMDEEEYEDDDDNKDKTMPRTTMKVTAAGPQQQQQHPMPGPLGYEHQIFLSGTHAVKTPFTFDTRAWEPLARSVLAKTSWDYVHTNAGEGSTCAKNVAAFSRYSILPQYLRSSRRSRSRLYDDKDKDGGGGSSSSSNISLYSDTSTTVLGQEIPYPLALAPVGVQKIFNREGECASARAAASLGLPYTLSSASSASIEDVAAAAAAASPSSSSPPPPPRRLWFQLYWPPRSHDDITASLLKRARQSGYTVLLVTVDTYVLGWRPGDLDNGYSPFVQADRIGVEIGFTDPVFRARFRERHGGHDLDDDDDPTTTATARAEDYDYCSSDDRTVEVQSGGGGKGRLSVAKKEWSDMIFPGHSHTWDDLEFLREHWGNGPIVIKGVQTVGDARRAVEAGCQGIVVSNHGGRQHDGGCASLAVLPRIVDAVGDKIDVLFDSGVRCGADALKAIALGAKCVLIGRQYIYGLALGGEAGVKHVLQSLCGEVLMGMHLAGLRDIEEVNRDVIVKDDELF